MKSSPVKSAPGIRETGVIRKNWAGQIKIGLFYPQCYALAMSNLGFQTLYRLLNREADVLCERFLADDLHALSRGRLLSLESRRAPADFDILAFSIAFENDYPNILKLIEACGLPVEAQDRDSQAPLIMAGGVAVMLNPEPLAAFFDLLLIGEAEVLLPDFLENYRNAADHRQLLDRIGRDMDGAYVPRHYQPVYHPDGPLDSVKVAGQRRERIRLPRVADVGTLETATAILTPDTTFADTRLIEVSRGCPHGCRFCSAGYIYRPPRYRDPVFLERCLQTAVRTAPRAGLVGTAVSDFPGIGELCRPFKAAELRLSFSSLRADALTDDLLAVLRAHGTKTATIAPEAGSARLRAVINKGLAAADILSAAEKLVRAGIPNLKLYFMLGLPTETGDDIEAIVKLCREIKAVFLAASRRMKRIGTITVNATPFVPKAATPFQWAGMPPPAVLKKRVRALRVGLQRIANVRFQSESLRGAYVQALLARGDRRVGSVLIHHHRSGGRWPQTLRNTTIDTDFFTLRERPADELLPWDFIDTGVRRDYLWREYQRALAGRPSDPCPPDRACKRCGVCDPAEG
jgi:radical SAM superfamily enzyme YgiQ (UPF0313 family)